MNIAMIPTYPLYLKGLKKWLGDAYDEQAILANPNIAHDEHPYGTVVWWDDINECTTQGAWELFLKCLRLSGFEITSLEELDKACDGGVADNLDHFFEEVAGDCRDVVKELLPAYRPTGMNLEDYASEELVDMLEPEVWSWLSYAFTCFKYVSVAPDVEKWYPELLRTVDENGQLITPIDVAISNLKKRDIVEELIKNVNSICRADIDKYADKIVELCAYDYIDKKYKNIRKRVAEICLDSAEFVMTAPSGGWS